MILNKRSYRWFYDQIHSRYYLGSATLASLIGVSRVHETL